MDVVIKISCFDSTEHMRAANLPLEIDHATRDEVEENIVKEVRRVGFPSIESVVESNMPHNSSMYGISYSTDGQKTWTTLVHPSLP